MNLRPSGAAATFMRLELGDKAIVCRPASANRCAYARGRTRMIRSELLNSLAQDNPDLRAEEVEQVVDIFFEEIAQRLSVGGRQLYFFGPKTRSKAEQLGKHVVCLRN